MLGIIVLEMEGVGVVGGLGVGLLVFCDVEMC